MNCSIHWRIKHFYLCSKVYQECDGVFQAKLPSDEGCNALPRHPDKCVFDFFFLFLNQNICCGYSKEPLD